MSCTPYSPTPGLFFNTIGFGLAPKGVWSFQRSGDVMQLKNGAAVAASVLVPTGSICNWLWFQATKFVALRSAATSGGFVDYRLWIFDLRVPAAVTYYEVPEILSTSAGQGLELDPAPDDSAFFIWLGTGVVNETKDHAVYLSDKATKLCGAGPAIYTAQRLAEFIAGQVWIYVSPGPALPAPHTGGGYLLAACDLPSGNCDVTTPASGTLDFGEVVIGGPASLATSSRNAVIRNNGNDCLDITGVTPPGGSAFTVGAFVPPLPRTLAPSDTLSIPVVFAPAAVGSFGPTSLAIGRNPAKGDTAFSCRGTARAARKEIGFSATSIPFGTVRVGAPGAVRQLTIENNGETPITVSVPAAPPGSAYQWTAVNNQVVNYAGSFNVGITFTPPAEGSFPGALTVISDAPGSPHTVTLSGTGCIPNAVLVPPASPITPFGNVEQGFRTVRVVTVGNGGDGTLKGRVRVQGADATLYGIQPPDGSVTTPVASYDFDILPSAACGGGPAGSGSVRLAIVLWANDVPRSTSAALVLEELSGTTVISSTTYTLSGTIVAAVPVDAGLVLDRSGSMAAGSKMSSAINAGRLFVRLLRPDVGDRVTIVRYNQTPEIVQGTALVTSATPPTQTDIESTINSTNFSPSGSTCIAGGVMVGRKQLDIPPTAPVPPLVRRSLVVLTDGIDNTAFQNPDDGRWYSIMGGQSRTPSWDSVDTQPLPGLGDIKVYAVGIGTDEQIDRGQLAVLSQATGGDYLVARDVGTAGTFELEKHFTQIFMGIVDLSVISDPVWDSSPGDEHVITFDLLRGDVGALAVVYDMPGVRLPFRLESPVGEVVSMTMVPTGFAARIGTTPSARFLEMKLPPHEPERYAGRWVLRVAHPTAAPGTYTHDLGKGPGRTRFGAAIAAGSNFRMQPYVTPRRVNVGDPLVIGAVISEAGLRVTGCRVAALVTSPSGLTWNYTLHDDGAHEDGETSDGEYASTFTHTAEGGSYNITFRAEGYSHDREPVVREAVLSKYVEGRLSLDPEPSNPNTHCCRLLVRIASAALIVFLIILLLLLFR